MTEAAEAPQWALTLYVSGAGPLSSAAISVVRELCDAELAGHYDLVVYDANDHPQDVIRDRILALPTLVKQSPEPRRYVVGDLTDLTRLRQALDLAPTPPSSGTTTDGGPS